MKKQKKNRRTPLKLAGGMMGCLVIGTALLAFSVHEYHVADRIQPKAPTTIPASTSAPASAPTSQPIAPVRPTSDSGRAVHANMASVTLLFSLLSFLLAATCAGLLIFEIYRSRPAWKAQTRYPKHEPITKHSKPRKPKG